MLTKLGLWCGRGCGLWCGAGDEGLGVQEGAPGWDRGVWRAGGGSRLRQGVGVWEEAQGCRCQVALTSSVSQKQWHVPSPAPTQRRSQVALHAALSTGTAPAAPIGVLDWAIGARRSWSGAMPWTPTLCPGWSGAELCHAAPDPAPRLECQSGASSRPHSPVGTRGLA